MGFKWMEILVVWSMEPDWLWLLWILSNIMVETQLISLMLEEMSKKDKYEKHSGLLARINKLKPFSSTFLVELSIAPQLPMELSTHVDLLILNYLWLSDLKAPMLTMLSKF